MPTYFRPFVIEEGCSLEKFPDCDVIVVTKPAVVPVAMAIQRQRDQINIVQLVDDIDIRQLSQYSNEYDCLEKVDLSESCRSEVSKRRVLLITSIKHA